MSDKLLARLREAARYDVIVDPDGFHYFTPESVQRGLERMRHAEQCLFHRSHGIPLGPQGNRYELSASCHACWAAMLDAFIHGLSEVRDA